MESVLTTDLKDNNVLLSLASSPYKGLCERFLQHELITPSQLSSHLRQASSDKCSLLRQLIEHAAIDAAQATLLAGWEYGIPVVDLDGVSMTALPSIEELPAKTLKKLSALPLKRDKDQLTVAIAYPESIIDLHELRVVTGLTIHGVLAPSPQLNLALHSYLLHNERTLLEDLESLDSPDTVTIDYPESGIGDTSLPRNQEQAPIVKFINKVLFDAVNRDASDIHFEPYEGSYRVRFRIDGVLIEIVRIAYQLRQHIAARLKVMARLDIAERRLPQDGTLTLSYSTSRSVEFRVSTLPTVSGEKIVLRLLEQEATHLGIEELGFSHVQRQHYERALSKPQGMVLVTGPTGSGKTVTLYTGLQLLNQTERNLCTAEDPVEIKLAGVNQISVQPKIDFTFSAALRAFLRQDPDVVMVGEIRDLETADIAIKAAQTGHLVLSTVHTNSASETLDRLANMGVAAFNIASAVSLIIAQRLVRRLCSVCKAPTTLPHQVLLDAGVAPEEIASASLYRAVGCKHCTKGYRGRIGVYEVAPISTALREHIHQRASTLDIERTLRAEGHVSLYQHALSRVLDGTTTLEEVQRVTQK